MFKRIMKIAGIIIGSVAVFAGAVFGVMAAMGKFKKKKIYPNRLFFAETEQVVIFDEVNDPDKWYYFVVSGENTESKYYVNQKQCYISFVNAKDAANLIELYDKNQNKLKANESGRFEIECNERVYYKIKPLDSAFNETDVPFGKVVIHALGEELSMVASSEDLTIWIDRAVNSVKVKNAGLDFMPSSDDSPFARQNVRIATTEKFYFSYESTPAASLYPTTKTGDFYGKKEVELYYKESDTAPYEKIDGSTDLTKFNGLVGWDENRKQFYFESRDVSTRGYDFYIATFATYQDKIDYYAMLEANPNDEPSERERLNHMVVTNVNIRTFDIGVKEVSFGTEDITLDLRNENLVTLTDDVTGATNLRLSMIGSDDRPNDVRFNSIEFIDTESVLGLSNVAEVTMTDPLNENNSDEFKLDRGEILGTTFKIDGKSYTIKNVLEDGKSISMYGKRLVYLESSTGELVCSNGYLLCDGEKLYLLSAGTYLGFFGLNDSNPDDKFYELLSPDFEYVSYSVVKPTGYLDRWNINVLDYDGTSDIYLKCLAVNSKEAHKYGKVITSTRRIAIEEIGLYFGENFSFKECVVNNTLTLRVPSADEETKTFADIVNIGENVSYDQCVFVTEVDEYNRYEISKIGKSFTIGSGADAKTYLLVGYEEGGKFVNAVKAIKQIDGVETKIYVMQFKNTDISDFAISDLGELEYHAIKSSNPINVDVLFKPTNITFTIDDVDAITEGYQLYANQTDYTLTIGGDDAAYLVDAGLKADNFKVYLNDSTIESDKINTFAWDSTNGKWTFKTNSEFNAADDYVRIAIVFNGVTIKSGPIYILSIKPTEVKYGKTTLYGSQEDADAGDKYQLVFTYDSGIVVDSTKTKLGTTELPSGITLNEDNSVDDGFKTNIDDVKQEFIYKSLNEDVFSIDGTTIQANRVGTDYLEVRTASGYVGYLKVVVSADDRFTLGGKTADQDLDTTSLTTTASSYNLKDGLPDEEAKGLAYEYNGNSIDSLVEIPNADSIVIDYFGGGEGSIEYKLNGSTHEYYYGSKDVDTNKILTIVNTTDGWEFVRPNYKYCDLTIKFNVKVITREADETITLNFSPATKINFNSEWNDQQIYKDTKILLVEESENGTFTNKPYYKITNPNISTEPITITSITLGGSDKSSCLDSAKTIFTPDATGKYTITFSNSEKRELYVVDNVIAKLTNDEFDSDMDCIYVDIDNDNRFITLYSFDTSVVYGKYVGIYPLSSATTGVDLDGSVAIKGATNIFKYNSINKKFYTNKMTNLNTTSVQEKIELTYNTNKLVIYDLDDNKVDFVNVTVNNKYTVTETAEYMFVTAFIEKNIDNMLKINGETLTSYLTLSSVEIDGYTIEDNDSDKFTIKTPITEYITKEITFTFGDYTYTTNVELRPYLPERDDDYKIWANTEGDNWKTDFFGSKKSALYAEIDSDKIKGVSVDYPADYDGERIIIFNGDKYTVDKIYTTSKTIYLSFTFAYDENREYTYTDKIRVVISNEYLIEAVYPYQGLTASGKPVLVSSDSDFNQWYLGVSAGELAIEPVLVGQTIKLCGDAEFQDRVSIKDHGGEVTENKINAISGISIVARSENLRSYSCEITGKDTIKFASNGGLGTNKSGYIVLKIVTTTGSETYYTIQLVNSQVTENTTTYSVTASGQNFVDNNGTTDDYTDDKFLGIDSFAPFTISNTGTFEFGKASFYLINYGGIYQGYGEDEIAHNGLTRGMNLSGKSLPTLHNYVTLKIAMIYNYDNSYINAGILTFYVTPSSAPSVKDPLIEGLTEFNDQIKDYPNGYYTATIKSGATEIANPFNESGISMEGYASGAAILDDLSDDNYEEFVELDDITLTTLKINKYVTRDVTFTVKYYFTNDISGQDRYVRIVKYTLEAFDHNSVTGNMNKTTGNRNGEAFNKIVTLNDLIGTDYNRKIAITNDGADYVLDVSTTPTVPSTITSLTIGGKPVVLKYDGTKYYFEFAQEQKQYSLNFTIKYLDICNPDSITDSFARAVTVTVKSDIDMNIATGSLGSDVSNPLLSTLIEDDTTTEEIEDPYTTKYPSYITITKTTASGVDQYTITGSKFDGTSTTNNQESGFTLYVSSGATLEISFNNWSYVGVDNGTSIAAVPNAYKPYSIAGYDSDGNFKFYFTHASANRLLKMTIKVKDSGGNYYCVGSGNEHMAATLNLNVQRTYTDLVVNYEINGANHEVIENCAGTEADTIDLQTDSGFFANITDPATAPSTTQEIKSNTKVFNTNRFTLMNGETELNDSTTSVYALFNAMGFFTADNPNKLTYLPGDGYSVMGNTLTFDTTTSQKWVEFAFSSNELGDIQYNFNLLPGKNGLIQTADRINGKQVTFNTTYASIYVNDSIADPNGIEKYLVGGNANDFKTLARINDEKNNVYYISDLEWGNASQSYNLSSDGNGKTYTAYDDNYEFKIRLEAGELKIQLLAKANRTTTKLETRVYTFSLYGDGEIVKDFKIVFANYDIAFNVGDVINGDSRINLSEKIKIKKNNDNTLDTLDSATMKGGTYKDSVTGQTYNSINNLASWDNTNKYLNLNFIASEITAHIDFEIYTDVGGVKYSLGVYTYSFTANRTFNFKINGTTITDDSVETNYLLTSQHVLLSDSSGYQDSYNSRTSGQAEFTINGQTSKYETDLLLQMAIKQLGVESVVGNDNMNNIISVTSSNSRVITFDKTNSKIKFLEDYYDVNESIQLTINVNLTAFGRGRYEFVWNIKPVGFINMVPKGEVVLGNSSAGFKSGTYVDLLSKSSTESRGIEFFNTSTVDANNSKISITGITVTSNVMDIRTGVVSSQSTVTLYDAYNRADGSTYTVTDNTTTPSTTKTYQVDIDGRDTLATGVERSGYLLDTNALKVRLPLVEQSEVPSATHHVKYTVRINYQIENSSVNLAWYQTHEVEYGVYNPVAIKSNSNADKEIDVDNNSTKNTYDQNNKTILIFSTATIENTEPMFNVTTSEQLSWADIDNMYIRFKINNSDRAGTVFALRDYVYYKLTSTNGKYVPSTGKFDNNTPTNDSDDVDSTTYTIDITKPYSDAACTTLLTLGTGSGKAGTLFNNFLNADLDVMSEGQVVTGIKAYKDERNPGFRLYTSNEIKSVAEADNRPTYTFGDIFKLTDYYSDPSLMGEMVLGINGSSVVESWIYNDTSENNFDIGSLEEKTIRIPLFPGSNNTTINVHGVTYTRSGSTLYSLSRKFYYIQNNNPVIAPNTISGIGYTVTEADDFTFTGIRFFKYVMEDGPVNYVNKIEIDQEETNNRVGISASYQIVGDDTTYTAHEGNSFTNAISIKDGKIYISKAFLQAYKNMNPSKTSIALKFNTLAPPMADIEFIIEMALPETATLIINPSKFNEGETLNGYNKAENSSDGLNTITLTKKGATSLSGELEILSLLDVNAYNVDEITYEDSVMYNIVLGATRSAEDDEPSYDYGYNTAHVKNVKVNEGASYVTDNTINLNGIAYYLNDHATISVDIEITYCINNDSNLAVTTRLKFVFDK